MFSTVERRQPDNSFVILLFCVQTELNGFVLYSLDLIGKEKEMEL
jgi:hypothetical protein